MPDAQSDASPGSGSARPRRSLDALAEDAVTVELHADFGTHADRLLAARTGFVVTDGPRLVAVVGHERLLTQVTRSGGDLFRHRPISVLLSVLGAAEPTVLPADCAVGEAVATALTRPPAQRLDPLVIEGPPLRLLDMMPLLLEHAAFAADAAAEADRQRRAAESAGRARTSFLATMSHELRTPLNAILGFVELLHEQSCDAREQARSLDVIQRNGRHLLSLISDMLDLTRLESEQGSPVHHAINPSAIVADVVELLQVKAIQGATILEVHVERTAPRTLAGDATRLRQVLLNIIGNAVKFSPGGRVSVRLGAHAPDGRAPTQWFLECRDSGIGIPPETIERIFEPFVQAEDGATRRFGGTGLGLTIVKRIVEAEDGTIHVESRPGHGSVFRIVLPIIPAASLVDAAEARDAAPPTPPTPTAAPPTTTPTDEAPPARILVVEDGPDNIRLFRTVLERSGHQVTIAENGAEGLRKAAEARAASAPFDCILMDRHMPIMDGCEATRRLRADGHDMPIIAVTASASDADRADFADAGCDRFLAKPVPPKRLREAIAAALAPPATPASAASAAPAVRRRAA